MLHWVILLPPSFPFKSLTVLQAAFKCIFNCLAGPQDHAIPHPFLSSQQSAGIPDVSRDTSLSSLFQLWHAMLLSLLSLVRENLGLQCSFNFILLHRLQFIFLCCKLLANIRKWQDQLFIMNISWFPDSLDGKNLKTRKLFTSSRLLRNAFAENKTKQDYGLLT